MKSDRPPPRELTSAVLHDLMNPLNAILMSVALIAAVSVDGAGGETIQRHTEAIRRSVQRLNRMLNELAPPKTTEPA